MSSWAITSLAVLPAGGLALGGSHCSTNDATPNTCDGGEFVRSIDDTRSTRFDVPHDLGQLARVVPSDAGDILLVGEDPTAHRLALQRVNFNGTFGTRDVFIDPPLPSGYFQTAVSGSTLWIAGGLWVSPDPTPTLITDNGFLLEAGL